MKLDLLVSLIVCLRGPIPIECPPSGMFPINATCYSACVCESNDGKWNLVYKEVQYRVRCEPMVELPNMVLCTEQGVCRAKFDVDMDLDVDLRDISILFNLRN